MRIAPAQTRDRLGEALQDYLRRALSYLAPLIRVADLAWLLTSYARNSLRRVEQSAGLPALQTVRSGLEQALGLRFDDAKGEHFFRSTLIQTAFDGIFSAWVQWARSQPAQSTARFDWHQAGWTLHVPMVRTLFEQVATPSRLTLSTGAAQLGNSQFLEYGREVKRTLDDEAGRFARRAFAQVDRNRRTAVLQIEEKSD